MHAQSLILTLYAIAAGILLLGGFISKEIIDFMRRRNQQDLPFHSNRRQGERRNTEKEQHQMASAGR